MLFSASSQWSKICFGFQWIIFRLEGGSMIALTLCSTLLGSAFHARQTLRGAYKWNFWKIQRHLNRVQSILALNWFKFEGDRKGSMIQLCVLHCWGVHFMRGRHSLGHGFDLLVILWCQTSLHSWDVFGSKNHVLINRHWTLKLWSINRE